MTFEIVGMSEEDRFAWQQALGVPGIVSVDLTAEQIMSLFSSPIEILPAPGAGKINLVDNVMLVYNYGTTSFVGGGNIKIGYDGQSSGTMTTLGSQPFMQTESKFVYTAILNEEALSAVVDKAVYLKDVNSDSTGGDGTATVTVTYNIADV